MKILMVTNTYSGVVGGLEKSVQSFTKEFRKLGHEVLIAGPDFVGEDFSVSADSAKASLPLSMPFPARLERKIARFKPDIIHTHHPFLMGDMGLRFSAYYGKPLVFTYHILFNEYAHYMPSLSPVFSEHFLTEMAAGFCNLTACVFAPSESVREILRKEGVGTSIGVVPTGIELNRFTEGNREKKRTELNIPREAVVLGHIGRFAEEKNLTFLALSASEFMKENEQVYFLCAGKGPCMESFEAVFKEAGVVSRVRFAGTLNGRDLADCYHAMDAFVFASKSETQGLVLCEAMAAGVPVIALDAPGVREVVKDLENGRLIPREDPREFQDALAWFVRLEPEEKARLKQKARETAAEFSINTCAERALQTYREAQEDYTVFLERQPEMKWWAWRCVKTEIQIMVNLLNAFGKALTAALGAKTAGTQKKPAYETALQPRPLG